MPSCRLTVLAVVPLCLAAAASAQERLALNLDVAARAAGARDAGAAPRAPAGRSLTLADATELALAHNLDIAIERVNSSVIDLQLAGLKASYLPGVAALFGVQRQTALPVTLLTGGQHVVTTTDTFNGALTQNIPWGGGTASVAFDNNRLASDSIFYNYNPAYNATLTLQYTQPLLRGLHADAVRQQILVTKTNRAISDLQLQATIVNTLSDVRNAYWDLVFAVDSIGAARLSVDLARQLVEEDRQRVAYGTMTELDMVSASAQEAAARHRLVAAEGNRRAAEVALKRLLVGGPDDPLWQETLTPVDRPAVIDEPIDLEATVRRALAERTDLAQARHQVAGNQATADYLRDRTRPQVDLVGSYSLAGIGGTQLVHSGDLSNPFTSPVIGTIPGSYGGALTTLAASDYPAWGIAVNVSYPLGHSAARADAARATVQIDQARTELRRMEVTVVTDVTNAAVAVRNNVDNVRTAATARELAVQQLQAEEKKFAAGVSTNYEVVQAQKDLADARNAELQAEVDYRKSLVEFDRLQHTTLQSAGVTVVSAGAVPPAPGSGRPASPAPSGAFIQ